MILICHNKNYVIKITVRTKGLIHSNFESMLSCFCFLVLLCISTRYEAIYIHPDMKDFVRYTDDGLYRGTINAFSNEWKKTFIDGSTLRIIACMHFTLSHTHARSFKPPTNDNKQSG